MVEVKGYYKSRQTGRFKSSDAGEGGAKKKRGGSNQTRKPRKLGKPKVKNGINTLDSDRVQTQKDKNNRPKTSRRNCITGARPKKTKAQPHHAELKASLSATTQKGGKKKKKKRKASQREVSRGFPGKDIDSRIGLRGMGGSNNQKNISWGKRQKESTRRGRVSTGGVYPRQGTAHHAKAVSKKKKDFQYIT